MVGLEHVDFDYLENMLELAEANAVKEKKVSGDVIAVLEDTAKPTVITPPKLTAKEIKDAEDKVYKETLIKILTDKYGDNFINKRGISDRVTPIILYPEITITNSLNMKHTIRNLCVTFSVSISARTLVTSISGTRYTLTVEEEYARYHHSHLSTLGVDSIGNYSTFCLGQGAISAFITKHNRYGMGFEEFEYFLYLIDNYVTWESLEGGPYRKITQIPILGNNNSTTSYLDISNEYIINKQYALPAYYMNSLDMRKFKDLLRILINKRFFKITIFKNRVYFNLDVSFELIQLIQDYWFLNTASSNRPYWYDPVTERILVRNSSGNNFKNPFTKEYMVEGRRIQGGLISMNAKKTEDPSVGYIPVIDSSKYKTVIEYIEFYINNKL